MDPLEYHMSRVYLSLKGYTDEEIDEIMENDCNSLSSKGFKRCSDFPGQDRFSKLNETVEPPMVKAAPERYVSFGRVLESLKVNPNRRYTREGWNGKGQYISLAVPKPSEKMTVPYIYIHTNYGANVPWFASQTDMLAEDWMEVTYVPRDVQTGSMEV